jgi:hypothetical protein
LINNSNRKAKEFAYICRHFVCRKWLFAHANTKPTARSVRRNVEQKSQGLSVCHFRSSHFLKSIYFIGTNQRDKSLESEEEEVEKKNKKKKKKKKKKRRRRRRKGRRKEEEEEEDRGRETDLILSSFSERYGHFYCRYRIYW